MYDIASLHRAVSVEDALRALAANENALVISGGTDVLVQNREGRHAGAALVSIHDLEEIRGVSLLENGDILIGAATCFTDLTNSPIIQSHIPMLGLAADEVGSPQIRNAGTIGGNVCNGVTSADTAPSLLALDAELELRSLEGERRVPLEAFYTGPGRTVRRRDELLCFLRIRPDSYRNVGGCYIKYGKRNAMEISTLGCAVALRLRDGVIERVRVAYGVAGPTPARCAAAEEAALGKPATAQTVEQAADVAVRALHPRTSWRASREFRLQLSHELLKRAMTQAIANAGGNADV